MIIQVRYNSGAIALPTVLGLRLIKALAISNGLATGRSISPWSRSLSLSPPITTRRYCAINKTRREPP